jgi:hypothetical protein
LRPEKSWRPIVTVEVDKHHSYEFCLGCDGQNPNHKDFFRFHDANPTSLLDVKIWHKPQTKRKTKKRHLVAVATYSLGELLKRQEVEPKLEVRLQCVSKHAIASKGKSQSGALFHFRLHAPPSISKALDEPPDTPDASDNDSAYDNEYASNSTTSSSSSDTLNDPPSPISEVPQVAESGLRRRRIRGYAIFSDDEPMSEEYISDDAEDSTTKVPPSRASVDVCQKVGDHDELSSPSAHSEVLAVYQREIHLSDAEWFSASILPKHVQELKVPPSMNAAEEVLASFTSYRELKEAVGESHFEKVFYRLQQEWTYVGGLLVALAALNTGAFSLSTNSIFRVDKWCQCAIATSSISTGLGIACDAWFLFRYSWADLDTIRTRAKTCSTRTSFSAFPLAFLPSAWSSLRCP